jgi:hypothetical protein
MTPPSLEDFKRRLYPRRGYQTAPLQAETTPAASTFFRREFFDVALRNHSNAMEPLEKLRFEENEVSACRSGKRFAK